MKVSVIIPVYNAEKYLDKCIKSLIGQTLKDIEFIFINDGSTDASGEILAKYKEKDSRITVIEQKNKGVSASRNIAISLSRGKYIGFVDSDDYIEHDMYESMYNKIIEENSELIICDYIQHIFYKKKEKKLYKQFLTDKYKKEDVFEFTRNEFLTRHENGYCCNKLYSSTIIKNNNIVFDEKITIAEDLLFNLNYLNYCNNISYINKYNYHYIDRAGSATNSAHKNGFDGMKKIYYLSIENCKSWYEDCDNILNLIDKSYAKIPYIYSMKFFNNRNVSSSDRKNNMKRILNDSFTNEMKYKVINKDFKLSLRYRIFYKIYDINFIIYFYMKILSYVHHISRRIKIRYYK